jgi:hypothetical protein
MYRNIDPKAIARPGNCNVGFDAAIEIFFYEDVKAFLGVGWKCLSDSDLFS